jgi:hypothetical protein
MSSQVTDKERFLPGAFVAALSRQVSPPSSAIVPSVQV